MLHYNYNVEIMCLKLYLDEFIVVYLTSSCVNWAFFGTRGPLKKPNLHMNELKQRFFVR
jgi:hypothetical protein